MTRLESPRPETTFDLAQKLRWLVEIVEHDGPSFIERDTAPHVAYEAGRADMALDMLERLAEHDSGIAGLVVGIHARKAAKNTVGQEEASAKAEWKWHGC